MSNTVHFKGFNEQITTFLCDDTVTEGVPVSVKADGSVTKAAAGAPFAGIAKSVRNGYCAVQCHGFITVSYTGTITDCPVLALCADGTGGLKSGAGRNVIVLTNDTTSKTIGIDLI